MDKTFRGENRRFLLLNSTTEVINDMAICLGPSGSGKTLLLKKLQNVKAVDNTTTSVSTVGTDMFTIKISSGDVEKQIVVREVGGVMAPLWPKYFDGIKKVLYVVDTSNLCQISAAGVLLYTILLDPRLKKAKILLILTKMDVSYRQMRNEALLMLQMRRLKREITQNITIVEASAITGEGRNDILNWLNDKTIKQT
ncbi:PREDICTED: ADP-ribosylation factor-like protein 16 [Nicrophorus vespilloides]|uniref:ADP-ribosylation factor-like protein 16 n=1 Tax=Nicrophorus vespilloides TaxID=110193 RepID=A0ABM1M7L7_NICVS|nr:PREDICTED: ADP-ribosylation factor-like protein 16 [Nicrophorus vespilloides]